MMLKLNKLEGKNVYLQGTLDATGTGYVQGSSESGVNR